MGIQTFSRQNSSALEQECSWDPAAILGIINRDTRGFTCVGYAPSKGRRCQNPIAKCNRDRVFDMLDTLALSPSSSRKVASMLPKIAALSLCRRFHQDQADKVAEEWQARIASMKPRNARTRSWRVEGDVSSHSTATTATWRTRQPSPERPREKPRATRPTPAQEKQRWRGEDDQSQRERERLEKELERMKEELERLWNDKREKDRQAKEAKEKERKERKEKEKKDEEKREQKRKEQEKKDQERREQEKKAKQEREARDKNERERQERTKAAKGKEEWKNTWENYQRRWNKFKATSASVQGDIHTAIPWPVKSGQYADVKDVGKGGANVEEFFRKGCLEMGQPVLAYSLMGEESKKWHPDKLAALFKGAPTGAEEKELVTMIGQIVIKLRAEAQRLRDGLRGD